MTGANVSALYSVIVIQVCWEENYWCLGLVFKLTGNLVLPHDGEFRLDAATVKKSLWNPSICRTAFWRAPAAHRITAFEKWWFVQKKWKF
jgi:hypothetical protein